MELDPSEPGARQRCLEGVGLVGRTIASWMSSVYN